MRLTKQQLEAVKSGQSVRLNERGTDVVVLRADLFEQLGSPVPEQNSEQKPKTPRKSGLTNSELKALAAKHKPPQSWYEKEEEGLH